MRVIVTGGGTGGHAFPALALIEELQRRDPHVDLWYVGKRGNIEERLARERGFPFRAISVGALARRGGVRNLWSVCETGWGFLQSLLLVRRFRPQVVVGTGGYVSVPPVAAAALLRVPTVIHEQNSVPGRANRLLSRWARVVATTFVESAQAFVGRDVRVTGNPVREALLPGALAARDVHEARRSLGLDPAKTTVVVMGGSQGARALTEATLAALDFLPADTAQVLLIAGTADAAPAAQRAARSAVRCEVRDFVRDMAAVYRAADLVVCRAGASTLAEVTVAGLPAILVPYPYAMDDHQRTNAEAIARTGAAEVLPEAELSGPTLAARLQDLLADGGRLHAMGAASRQAATPGAAESLADVVCDVALPEEAAA